MKTALVTGGYRGLGLEVARQLSGRGFRVLLSARQREAGLAAAAKLSNASFLEMDITNAASIVQAVRQVPQLDVLINNAAILLPEDENILQLDPEIVARTLMTNAVGALQVSQAFVPLLKKSPAGRIINVSSGGGQLGDTGTWAPAVLHFQDSAERRDLPARGRTEGPGRRGQLRLSRLVSHGNGGSGRAAFRGGGRSRDCMAGRRCATGQNRPVLARRKSHPVVMVSGLKTPLHPTSSSASAKASDSGVYAEAS